MKARVSFDSLTKRDREKLTQSMRSLCNDIQKDQIMWMWAIMLWTLHECEHYGRKRINRLLNEIAAGFARDSERFKLTDDPKKGEVGMKYGDLCKMWLEHMGIDVRDVYMRFH